MHDVPDMTQDVKVYRYKGIKQGRELVWLYMGYVQRRLTHKDTVN